MSRGEWILWGVLLAAEIVALVTAALLPRGDRRHLPLLVFVVVQELGVRALQVFVLERAPHPLAEAARTGALLGYQRLAYHVETALVTAWPAGVALAAWITFMGLKSRWPMQVIAAVWVAFVAGMAARFPLPTGTTQPALHAFHGAMVVAAALAIMFGWARRRERPATAVFLLASVELVIVTVGPYARGRVFADWRTVAAASYALGFAILGAVQLAWGRAPVRP